MHLIWEAMPRWLLTGVIYAHKPTSHSSTWVAGTHWWAVSTVSRSVHWQEPEVWSWTWELNTGTPVWDMGVFTAKQVPVSWGQFQILKSFLASIHELTWILYLVLTESPLCDNVICHTCSYVVKWWNKQNSLFPPFYFHKVYYSLEINERHWIYLFISCHPERKCPRYHQGWAFLLWFLLFPFSFLLQILFLYSPFSSFFFSSFPSSLFLQNMFLVRMSQRGILSIGCIQDRGLCREHACHGCVVFHSESVYSPWL